MGLIKNSVSFHKPFLDEWPHNLYWKQHRIFPTEPDYFTISNADTITVRYTSSGSPIQFRLGESQQWNDIATDTTITTGGEDVSFRGLGRTGLYTTGTIQADTTWGLTGSDIILSGNILLLLDYINPPTILASSCFNYMFYNCGNITDVSHLKIHADTIGSGSCNSMFNGNQISSLDGFTLPATHVDALGYLNMFRYNNITSLDNFILPAYDLGAGEYQAMFDNNNIQSLSNFRIMCTRVLGSTMAPWGSMFTNNPIRINATSSGTFLQSNTFRIPYSGTCYDQSSNLPAQMFSQGFGTVTAPEINTIYYWGVI